MANQKMTQVEYDCKIRALREENKLRTAPLRAMLAMKEQEKSVINQQMDDLRKRRLRRRRSCSLIVYLHRCSRTSTSSA